jgi:two-component system chemotaxis response regulator CheY
MRALIIDDSSTMRMMLAHLLAGHGYQTQEASDGADAMQKLLDSPAPDLVTLDWNMPVMNGEETLKAIRQNPDYKNSRILIISSETEQDRVSQALAGGSDEYLMKPFSPEAFQFKIEMLSQVGQAA